MEYEELIRQRYSVRNYSNRPVEADKIERIIQAATLAPTARNYQPQRIIIARSESALTKIRECTACHFDAPIVLICCYDTKAEAHQRHTGEGFGVTDTSIVMTHMMLEAANIGLGSCWVGIFNPDKIRELFHIPDTYQIVGLLPLGYPSEDASPSPLHTTRVNEGIFFYDDFN